MFRNDQFCQRTGIVIGNEVNTPLPEIRVLGTPQLILHEEEEVARTVQLKKKIEVDGVLKNPVIVAKVGERPPRYVLLDGVHRLSALKSLGCRDIVVQMVDYGSVEISVDVWHRVICTSNSYDLIRQLRQVRKIRVKKETKAKSRDLLQRKAILAHVLLANGESYIITSPKVRNRVKGINEILGACNLIAKTDRASESEATSLLKRGCATAVVFLPRFEKTEILKIAFSKTKLAAGVTRHIIPYRVLGLCVDLTFLKTNLPLEQKSKMIQEIVDRRIKEGRVFGDGAKSSSFSAKEETRRLISVKRGCSNMDSV